VLNNIVILIYHCFAIVVLSYHFIAELHFIVTKISNNSKIIIKMLTKEINIECDK